MKIVKLREFAPKDMVAEITESRIGIYIILSGEVEIRRKDYMKKLGEL